VAHRNKRDLDKLQAGMTQACFQISLSINHPSIIAGKERNELFSVFDEAGTFAEPFQFLGARIGGSAANPTRQAPDAVFNCSAVRDADSIV